MAISEASRLRLGVAWYPEHWPEGRWPEDIGLMRDAGLTVVRLAEFSWSTLEPSQGDFRFEWLDRAISALAEAGIVAVLGTPTAAPPAWLMSSRPGALAVDENGRRVQIGNRCHYCVNSPDFHSAVQRVVTAMAERFGDNANVIGWQIDNEFNRVCYCEHCRGLFQQYLAEKYGSLDELNEHWATRYWSQTYSAWDQIPIPIGPHNPGLMLEFKHFVTESYREFLKLQIEALRPHLRTDVWITHNFMGWFGGFDHYTLSEELDLASWDWYVASGHNDYLTSGAAHDLARGLKRRPYWVMETQPGCVNWSSVNNSLHKGEARAMAWHAVAHGAEAVLYWQWRSALNGQEQYHGTLVDQSGRPRPFYAEAKQIGGDFAAASRLLADSSPRARVALINSYDSRWSLEGQRHHRDFDYVAHLQHYYRPFSTLNIATDIISAETPLKGYRMVVAPALLVISDEQAERLTRFVKRGGQLVLTARCGMKDGYNALRPSRQPGPLADLAGVEVEEYYALSEPAPVIGNWFSGVSRLWAERLALQKDSDVRVIARYGASNGWLDDQVAITVRAHGTGLVYYVGAYLDDEAQQALIAHMMPLASVRPALEAPDGVEVRRRWKADGSAVYVAINHTRMRQSLILPWPMHEHLSTREAEEALELEPYGVAVLTRST